MERRRRRKSNQNQKIRTACRQSLHPGTKVHRQQTLRLPGHLESVPNSDHSLSKPTPGQIFTEATNIKSTDFSVPIDFLICTEIKIFDDISTYLEWFFKEVIDGVCATSRLY